MPITINGSTGIAGVDGSAATPAIQGTDTNTGVTFPAADTVSIATNGTEKMRVTSIGTVGIGTTNPVTMLHLSNAGSYAQSIRLTDTTANRFLDIAINPSGPYLYADGAYDLQFYTNNSERMRINSSGQTTLNGATAAGDGITINGALGHYWFSYSGYSSYRYTMYLGDLYWNNGGDRMKLSSGGQLFTTTGTISSLSDVRFKENIEDAQNYLAKLSQVKIRKFSFKEEASDKPTRIGVIAQELETVLPEMVEDDAGSDGEIRKTVKYTDFVPMLVKAIQELSAKVDALQTEINALKGAA